MTSRYHIDDPKVPKNDLNVPKLTKVATADVDSDGYSGTEWCKGVPG